MRFAGQQLVSPTSLLLKVFWVTARTLAQSLISRHFQDVHTEPALRPFSSVQVTQPLSQLHRIRLNIKQAMLMGDISKEQLRGQQQDVVSNVKRTCTAELSRQRALWTASPSGAGLLS